jgi:chaperone BCS1
MPCLVHTFPPALALWFAGMCSKVHAKIFCKSLGVLAAALRRAVNQAAVLTRRQLLVNLEITSKDPSYLWFLQWMEAQKKAPPALATSLSGRLAARMKSHDLAVETSTVLEPSGGQTVTFNLVPGPGRHFFRYNRAWFQVERERDSKMMDLNVGVPFETVKITTLSRDRWMFPQLLAEARELGKAARSGRTVIYTAWATEWRPFGQPRPRRLLESVVLDRGIKDRIVDDVRAFMGRGQWYAERGIPYRRGYLLHGPPGSGKSSFIQALAGSLHLNIAILNLSERGLTDDKLNHLLANAPEQTILLLEDIDAAFGGREKTSEDGFAA